MTDVVDVATLSDSRLTAIFRLLCLLLGYVLSKSWLSVEDLADLEGDIFFIAVVLWNVTVMDYSVVSR